MKRLLADPHALVAHSRAEAWLQADGVIIHVRKLHTARCDAPTPYLTHCLPVLLEACKALIELTII